MSQNIKQLKNRIKSVDNTLHLTKAMGLVASSKIRKATDRMMKGREYESAIGSMIHTLVASPECANSPYLAVRPPERTRLVIVAGDRGLAGGYNANIFRLSRDLTEGAEITAIGKRAVGAAAGVTAIVLYWLIYFWQDHLADWGDYRFFSYNFHEIWVGLGLMVVPAVTFLWLAAVLRRCIRQKTWRKNAVLLCALALIVSAQTAWFASQRDQWETHAAGTVEIVDEQHIRLKNKGEVVVELAVPPSVKNLLVEDTVVYNVVYTHQANDRHNDYGTCRLQYITAIDLPPEYFN